VHYLLQEYSQHVADSAEMSESLVSPAADMSAVSKRNRVPSASHEDNDEPACSMEDVIQLLQLLSAIASDTQSTGVTLDFHVLHFIFYLHVSSAFSTSTLLIWQQEGHLACKKHLWGAGAVICLGEGADLHMMLLMPLPLTHCLLVQ